MKNIFIFLMIFVLSGCSEESKEERISKLNECVEAIEKKCKRACQADPIGMYCVAKHGQNIMGSGCVREMKNLSTSSQIEKCYTAAECELSWEAHKQCSGP